MEGREARMFEVKMRECDVACNRLFSIVVCATVFSIL
jgi:hypothetical protein